MRLDITVLAALTTLAGACGNVTDPEDIADFIQIEPEAVNVSVSVDEAVESVDVGIEEVQSHSLDSCPACGRG